MRILRYTLTLCLLSFLGTAAHAQFQFGAGVVAGGNFDLFGAQARGQYEFTEVWRGAADFTYYFESDATVWELSPNAHYIFQDNGDGQKFYGLAGLSIYHVSVDLDLGVFGNVDTSDTEVGFNIGAGANVPLGGILGYAEAKFAVNTSEFGLTAGVLFGN